MPHPAKVLLVIPAYNEAMRIGSPLRAYLGHVRGRPDLDCRFLVVLNGCRDDTRSVIEALCAEFPEVSFIEHLAPIGKGGAILSGFRYSAGYDWVGFADADGATPAASLFCLLDDADADVIIGVRDISRRHWSRRSASLGFNFAVRGLLAEGQGYPMRSQILQG
jgi:cellulose synthase/poly-beta-1,6-N-acetylglucosamine synthase-like glycosyltransferase